MTISRKAATACVVICIICNLAFVLLMSSLLEIQNRMLRSRHSPTPPPAKRKVQLLKQPQIQPRVVVFAGPHESYNSGRIQEDLRRWFIDKQEQEQEQQSPPGNEIVTGDGTSTRGSWVWAFPTKDVYDRRSQWSKPSEEFYAIMHMWTRNQESEKLPSNTLDLIRQKFHHEHVTLGHNLIIASKGFDSIFWDPFRIDRLIDLLPSAYHQDDANGNAPPPQLTFVLSYETPRTNHLLRWYEATRNRLQNDGTFQERICHESTNVFTFTPFNPLGVVERLAQRGIKTVLLDTSATRTRSDSSYNTSQVIACEILGGARRNIESYCREPHSRNDTVTDVDDTTIHANIISGAQYSAIERILLLNDCQYVHLFEDNLVEVKFVRGSPASRLKEYCKRTSSSSSFNDDDPMDRFAKVISQIKTTMRCNNTAGVGNDQWSAKHREQAVKYGTMLSRINANRSNNKQSIVSSSGKNNNKTELSRLFNHTDIMSRMSHCWRECPENLRRINKIYFEHQWAGLDDRFTVIKNLAQIAGYLCATLEFPPPWVSLTPTHNGGKIISKNLTWYDFYNLTFLQDHSPALISLVEPPDHHQDQHSNDTSYWRKVPFYNTTENERYKGWLHLVSHGQSPQSLVEDFETLQSFSWNQQRDCNGGTTINAGGFIWEIHRSLFESDLFNKLLPEPTMINRDNYDATMKPMLPSYRHFHPEIDGDPGCVYINIEDKENYVPTKRRMLLEELKSRIQREAEGLAAGGVAGGGTDGKSTKPAPQIVYGFFHVRRGDAIDECDSSIEVLGDFLRCSLNGAVDVGSNRHITLLFASDEKNEMYRRNVKELAHHFPHVSILDLDKMTTEVIHDAITNRSFPVGYANNFFTYELQNGIHFDANLISFFLDKHRTNCPKCVPLLEKYPSIFL